MSSQTVYFTNPSVISGLQSTTSTQTSQIGTIQSQIGTTANQVSTYQLNLTGALYNSTNLFVDKWTFPKGMGPYQIDCIPMVVKDTFAMPKFSQNTSSQSGGAFAIKTGTNYTIATFDTETSYDVVVYAPSVRSTLETSLVFAQSGANELDNLGTWAPLEDYRGPYNTQYSNPTTVNRWQALFGSTGLGQAYQDFWILCSSGTTSTGARQTALDTILSHPDYTFIKNKLKYPFKVFNQVKGVSEFQFDNLLDLNGNPLVNTGANGITGYNTQVTSTTYSATGNLLPVSQNINASGAKMGLLLNFLGTGMTPNVDCYSYQAASLGYVVVNLPSSPLSSYYQRYGGGFKTTSQLLAEKIITVPVSMSTGIYNDTQDLLGNTANENVLGTTNSNGFWRIAVHSSTSQDPTKLMWERYFYQIKAILHKLGIANSIDFNNVIVSGFSLGGQSIVAAHTLLGNSPAGNASQFMIQGGTKPFLMKAKALININGSFRDFSQKVDSVTSQYNITNNRFVLSNIAPLKVPMITITNDFDMGYSASQNDNLFNGNAQTVYQVTKQVADWAGADTILAKSAVFYKCSNFHASPSYGSRFINNEGENNGVWIESFYSDWLQGWNFPLNPSYPSLDNVYESGLVDEIKYVFLQDIYMINVIELMTHRFCGPEFPFPLNGMRSLGLRCDIGPTHCDILTDHEYMRVGPWAQLTYDSNYNLILNNVPGATGPTQPPVSFYATGTGQTIGATTLQSTNANITSLTGTNAYFNTLTVNTGVFTSIVYQNETIVNSVTTNEVVQNLTGTNVAITNLNVTSGNISSLTVGTGAKTYGYTRAMAFGQDSIAAGINSLALGRSAQATGTRSLSIGVGSVSKGDSTTAIGWSSTAEGDYSLNMGYATTVVGNDVFAVGRANTIVATLTDVVGGFNTVQNGSSQLSIFGGGNYVDNSFTVGVHGDGNQIVNSTGGYVNGDQNVVVASTGSTVVGDLNTLTECANSFIIGSYNSVTGTAHSVIGNGIQVGGNYAVAIGDTCVGQSNTVTIGKQVSALNGYNIAVGNNISVGGSTGAIALGNNMTITASSPGFFVNQIRGVAHALGVGVLHYNPSTFEITYSTN